MSLLPSSSNIDAQYRMFLETYRMMVSKLTDIAFQIDFTPWTEELQENPLALPPSLAKAPGAEDWEGRLRALCEQYGIDPKGWRNGPLGEAIVQVVQESLQPKIHKAWEPIAAPAPVPTSASAAPKGGPRRITIDTKNVEYEFDPNSPSARNSMRNQRSQPKLLSVEDEPAPSPAPEPAASKPLGRTMAAPSIRLGSAGGSAAAPQMTSASPPEAPAAAAPEPVGASSEASAETSAPPPSAVPAEPERRWINAEITGHDVEKPLTIGESYVLELGVDVTRGSGAAAPLPASDLWFGKEEQSVELTVQIDSDDFEVAQRTLPLVVPRTGKSKGKARFDVTPLRAGASGRGVLTATLSKQGNFLQQVEISYTVGTANDTSLAEPPATVTHGRTLNAASTLKPRTAGMSIKPAPGSGYECTVWGAVSTRVALPITMQELGDAINAVRTALLAVVMQLDAAGEYVFQTGIDIPAADRDVALRTLADAGARLFQRIFYHPAAGADTNRVGDWLRTQATRPGARLELQIVAEHFPVPWGILYMGDVSAGAAPDWEQFLGMRHVIEQIPLQTRMVVDDCVIASDQPALRVSVNVNETIDAQMQADFVKRQRDYWAGTQGKLGVQVVDRQQGAQLIQALNGDANEQFLYLYCHAASSGIEDLAGIDSSCLIMSNNERVSLKELNLRAPMSKPLTGNPLVFVNACESAELSPTFYDGFVPYFMAKGARGVIGTECKTPALFATEWALRFFPEFLSGAPLGDVFLDLRREFMQTHGNPLGLLYAVHCDGDTYVQPGLTTH